MTEEEEHASFIGVLRRPSNALLIALVCFWIYRIMVSSHKCRTSSRLVRLMAKVPLATFGVCGVVCTMTASSMHQILELALGRGLAGQPGWLAIIAFGAAPCTACSCVIGVTHMVRIVMPQGALHNIKRQRVLQVLMLPMLYSCMSLKSVILLLGPIEPDTYKYAESDVNFNVADFYEAYVLTVFSRLIFDEVKAWYRGCDLGAGHGNLRTETSGPLPDDKEKELLVSALCRQTTRGVQTFVVVSALYALCSIVTSWTSENPVSSANTLLLYLFGAGFLASTIAISSVVQIELQFHDKLHSFRCAPKFWSVKVLVSIAFVQKLVMSFFSGYLQKKDSALLYASLICYELLVITILHVFAWPSSEGWLDTVKPKRDSEILNNNASLLSNAH